MDAAQPTGKSPWLSKLALKAHPHHQKIPYLRRLPLPAVAIVLFLAFLNICVWIAAGIVLHFHPTLLTSAILSWTFGLRHALDADHISAIDITVRRLQASGRPSALVGTFFSLGHSTIVVVTCLVVASTSAAITKHFGPLGTTGNAIGSCVSAAFLLLLGAMNVWILVQLGKELRFYHRSPLGEQYPGTTEGEADPFAAPGQGPMAKLLRRVFGLIDRPWKMYPLGVLFGLGFDTSSEIALLGLSAVSATRGTSLWLIMVFPALFTAGMCLIDTIDGAAMSALYSSARLARDRVGVAYYQTVLTGITVLVAALVGSVQFLTMIQALANPEGKFWDGVGTIGDHYDVLGGAICGCFAVFGGLAAVLYRPWRRRLDARRRRIGVVDEDTIVHIEEPTEPNLANQTQREASNSDTKSKQGVIEIYTDEVLPGSSRE